MMEGYSKVGGIVGTMPDSGVIKSSIHNGYVKRFYEFDGIAGFVKDLEAIKDCETLGEVAGRYTVIREKN